ncbi:GNAT family N-acetyltransferase [Acidisoma cellulosilytica]|uniref:GNAT family N-acetyltransferase n=1 Tax=Acidisoma cellulosilyticum TaxID=2802395 RepID=A0A963Z7S3_9PROT|nr:GNAT family N-acetyltransferase [Acidisoma cellulosilyticum]MCB8883610.1 GNAT family N-acetyltransferase [Acidisoma cellulosilyticum]
MITSRITRIDQPTEGHRQAILDPLDAFSDPRAGDRHWPEEKLCLAIRGPDGAVRGGLWGRFYYDWLFIELIFIPSDLRGQDLGSVLLAMAEARARSWGAVGVWLDTFSFQARGFYEKRGYVVFGEIADYPVGHQRFFLQKRLDDTAPPPIASHPLVEDIPNPSLHDREAIGTALNAFNDSQLGGGEWPERRHAFVLTNEAETVIGGLWARSYYDWLYVGLLFVPDSLRGQGIGTQLLALAEDEARSIGARGIWLDTFSFQAPDFYPRHGFVPFGRLESYPNHHDRTFFTKTIG